MGLRQEAGGSLGLSHQVQLSEDGGLDPWCHGLGVSVFLGDRRALEGSWSG